MNKNDSANQAPKVPRNTIEKKRRTLMKKLCSQLASIIPKQQTMVSPKLDQLDFAIGYIKDLKERIQCMKNNLTTPIQNGDKHNENSDEILTSNLSISVEDRDSDSALEWIIVRGLSKGLRLSEIVSVLNEEGLAVVNTSFSSTRDHTVFVAVHTQVISARIGVELPRLRERLNGLVDQSTAQADNVGRDQSF